MDYSDHLARFVRYFLRGIGHAFEAAVFTRRSRLWEGLFRYGWLSRVLVLAVALASVPVLASLFDWINLVQEGQVLQAGLGESLSVSFQESKDLILFGGFKYVVLILMEVVIFHFTRRTIEMKTGQKLDTSFQAFLHAEWRMIRLTLFSALSEAFWGTVIVVVGGLVLGSFGKSLAILSVQSFFMGFAMMDNYFELKQMSIRDSLRTCLHYAGLAVAIGAVANLMLAIPLVGSVAGPLIGSVTATLALHHLEQSEGLKLVFAEKAKS